MRISLSELRAVGGVAHSARQHRDGRVGAVRVDQRPVVVERVVDPLHRLAGEAAVGIDALAEPGDLRPALELGRHPILGELGDEQAGRVAADVDDGDAHARILTRSGSGRGPPGVASRGPSLAGALDGHARRLGRLARARPRSRARKPEGRDERADEGEAAGDDERDLEAVGECGVDADAGMELAVGLRGGIAARIARPSAPPNIREVLTRPEARPASCGATP